MVKLVGPMLSLEARGALGKAITYKHTRGRSTCGRWFRPSNPQTQAQMSIRGWNRRIASAWAGVPTDRQASWQTTAADRRIAPYHAYLSANMKLWMQQRAATQVAGAPGTLGVAFYSMFTPTTTVPGKITFLSQFSTTNTWNVVYFSIPTGESPFGRINWLDCNASKVSVFWGAAFYGHPLGIYDFYSWGYGLDGAQSNIRGPVARVVI